MPYNGSGVFQSLSSPTFPAVAGQVIYADRFNSNLSDIFGGLTNCITRDGQSPASANLPMNGFKLTGLGNGTGNGQAIVYGQASANLQQLTISKTSSVDTNQLFSWSDATNSTGFLSIRSASGLAVGIGSDHSIDFSTGQAGVSNAFNFRMRLDTSGNLGIGGYAGATERLALFTPNGTRSIIRWSQAGQRDWYAGILPSSPNFVIQDASISLDRLSIDTSGRVTLGSGGTSLRTLNIMNTVNGYTDVTIQSRSYNGAPGGSTLYFGNLNNDAKGSISYDTQNEILAIAAASTLQFITNSLVRVAISSSGVLSYGGIEVGFRGIPITTVGLDPGKCFYTSSGFTLTTGWPDGTAFSVVNNSGSAFTITQGAGMTLRLAGTATTGNRTLAPRGMASILITASGEAYISGAGVS